MQAVDQYLKLDGGVKRVRRGDHLLLVKERGSKTVRVSPAAQPLIPQLESGIEYEDLVHALKVAHPDVVDVRPSLDGFLKQLQRNDLLLGATSGETHQAGPRRFGVFQPDHAAKRIARGINMLPGNALWGLLGVMLVLAMTGVVLLPHYTSIVPLTDFAASFSLYGFLVFALIVVPLHEAGHAVACRLVGCPVTEAGIVLHGGLVPGPYVKTNQIYLLDDKMKRFWVPAAGPIVNLFAAGVCAWTILLSSELSPEMTSSLVFLYVLCTLFVFLDTNPFTASDGSHMLEALLEDELARKTAFSPYKSNMANPSAIRLYRIISVVHVLVSISVLAVWLWK